MRARFDDPSSVDHHDAIGMGNGAQAVSDHETGAVAHQFHQAGLNQPLALGIQVAGRFVQDQDRGRPIPLERSPAVAAARR